MVIAGSFMVYSHWLKPRSGQGPGNNGLYETVEVFTLNLSQDRGCVLLFHVVLVPVPVPVSTPVLLSVNIPLDQLSE